METKLIISPLSLSRIEYELEDFYLVADNGDRVSSLVKDVIFRFEMPANTANHEDVELLRLARSKSLSEAIYKKDRTLFLVDAGLRCYPKLRLVSFKKDGSDPNYLLRLGSPLAYGTVKDPKKFIEDREEEIRAFPVRMEVSYVD